MPEKNSFSGISCFCISFGRAFWSSVAKLHYQPILNPKSQTVARDGTLTELPENDIKNPIVFSEMALYIENVGEEALQVIKEGRYV